MPSTAGEQKEKEQLILADGYGCTAQTSSPLGTPREQVGNPGLSKNCFPDPSPISIPVGFITLILLAVPSNKYINSVQRSQVLSDLRGIDKIMWPTQLLISTPPKASEG